MLAAAGVALTAVITGPDGVAPREVVALACEAPALDLLLVEWLDAIIFEMATRGLLFSDYSVTIDGSETGGARPIRCYQSGWTWYIETPQKENGFTAVLETGDDVSPKSVDLRGVGDFTGSYWANHIGNAEVTGDDGKFTISGSAAGNFDQDPMTAVTANFRIEADC